MSSKPSQTSSKSERPSGKVAAKRGCALRVAGLFAGIGGIELGLARAGHETTLLCDVDSASQAVLRHRFGSEIVFDDGETPGDVRALKEIPAGTSLLTAGFPCQDLSQAGRTRGIRGARSGLVGEVFRLLEKSRPSWVLIENVPFMLHLANGEAMHVIISALEDLGYRWAYRVVDSRAFGLPQRRRRVYLLASQTEDPRTVLFSDGADAQREPAKDEWSRVACGFYWTEGNRGLGWTHDAVPTLKGGSGFGIPSAPAIVLPSGKDGERIGTPAIEDAERLQGFEPGWTEPAAEAGRASFRWRLVGNSVTVDAAEWIGNRLQSPGYYEGADDRAYDGSGRWPTACYNVDGKTRVAAGVSEWPFEQPGRGLSEFLSRPLKPLSVRASGGFYNRFSASSLRKPHGFLEVFERHLAAVS